MCLNVGSGPLRTLTRVARPAPVPMSSCCVNASRDYRDLIAQLVKLPFDEIVSLGETPKDSLTLLLLLDQLPRNFGRGTDYPFTKCDPLAVRLAEHFVLKLEHDKRQPPYKRMWYYVPLSHCESLPHQELALAKFAEGCWDYREGEWKEYHGFMRLGLESAWKHYGVISKFGRYPGRNVAMKRENTPEEKKYIEEGGDLFR
jgi:uncharacterized protein (DUF924 family)